MIHSAVFGLLFCVFTGSDKHMALLVVSVVIRFVYARQLSCPSKTAVIKCGLWMVRIMQGRHTFLHAWRAERGSHGGQCWLEQHLLLGIAQLSWATSHHLARRKNSSTVSSQGEKC
jgi:hypothetical protein